MNKNFVDIKGKTLFSMFLIAFLLISTNKVNIAAASPDTYIYVDPPEVRDILPDDTYPYFSINISVADAPETYTWEIYLSWDPTLLELVTVDEGDFLHRGLYTTTFIHVPLSVDEANVDGEINVGCSLKFDPPWASGDGWLCTLWFQVMATGNCVLNLFDTRLWDHIRGGSADYTYHPNNDGFFYNVNIHDIAITNVTASLTETGELVTVNVTVTNEGNYTETSETFNVTVYADVTVYEYEYDIVHVFLIKTTIVVGDETIVGTQTVTETLAPDDTTTLTFTWNTTGVAGGNYTISAEAMGDDDTRDNLFIGGAVVVQVHDIAITNVVPWPIEVTVGESVTINVTVVNQGSFNETFNVTVSYDSTVIETKTGISLESVNSTILSFTWSTTDVAEGTYTITAEASVVPDEIDTTNNTKESVSSVIVRGEAAPDILLYAAVGIVIIVVAAAAVVYFIKFRKPK